MFSLSYLPTAERLTVVVVKARNLKLPSLDQTSASPQELQNVFVKVFESIVMNSGCRSLTKKRNFSGLSVEARQKGVEKEDKRQKR